jgi:phage terminase small subunit
MPKKHKPKKKPSEEESKSSELLRAELRKRLHTKCRMMKTARKGGTSQEVQSIMQKFNDGDEEKEEMMREIQEDVKGMKSKDAKKYLRQVMSGMNNDQTDTLVVTLLTM